MKKKVEYLEYCFVSDFIMYDITHLFAILYPNDMYTNVHNSVCVCVQCTWNKIMHLKSQVNIYCETRCRDQPMYFLSFVHHSNVIL